jgi:glycosyltransferase involved in cell wall biosynthesis
MLDQPLLPGRLSLVIPAHNESENLPPLLRSCREVLPRVAADWEVVLVDDGSTDGEAEVAARAMEADAARLRVIRHERKSGYGVTVADGLRAAAGDFVGFMDGDGQFAPADMVLLAELIASGADLAGGWRVRRADPWHRSVVSRTFNVLVRVLYGIRFRDLDCGFKLMRRTALEAVSPLRSRAALINTELYFKASRRGCQVKQVGIPHHPRLAGVRSGGRLKPILRAVRELVLLRIRLAREGF